MEDKRWTHVVHVFIKSPERNLRVQAIKWMKELRPFSQHEFDFHTKANNTLSFLLYPDDTSDSHCIESMQFPLEVGMTGFTWGQQSQYIQWAGLWVYMRPTVTVYSVGRTVGLHEANGHSIFRGQDCGFTWGQQSQYIQWAGLWVYMRPMVTVYSVGRTVGLHEANSHSIFRGQDCGFTGGQWSQYIQWAGLWVCMRPMVTVYSEGRTMGLHEANGHSIFKQNTIVAGTGYVCNMYGQIDLIHTLRFVSSENPLNGT